jgi:ubiquitin carboxyl-terminal hydrolase 10
MTLSSGKHASTSASKPSDETKTRKDTIIHYLLHLSNARAGQDEVESEAESQAPPELPEELKKYQSTLQSGFQNISKVRYVRRGMKNDANNCYVNVVIQSLLPCSALMQLLSHCDPADPDRPFYTGMVRLCKEFHRKPDIHGDALNVLQLPQVKEIISTWQSIGAQQDAGEFLFYMLNGIHEECKWKVLPSESTTASLDAAKNPAGSRSGSGDGDDWAQVGKHNRKMEVRSAGVHEDSPVVRIFGGVLRSSVRSKAAKADSVTLEAYNHLILDISSPAVDSVLSALEAYCGAEAVNEGRAMKRLQFKMLPKVLIVNLKRFSYNKDTGMPQKIKKPVKYEEKLTFDRNWLVDEVEPPEYHLTAVICHHGDSANGGHYNAAVRYNTEWYMYDDALVRQMELREVMNQQFTAYLLLYQCHDKVDIRP